MRFRKSKDVKASIGAATRASEEAAGRLAETRDLLAIQQERARNERATLIASLKRLRAANNLSKMILDTVERESGGPGETGGATH